MDPHQEHTPKQASHKSKAAIKWNVSDLLAWIEEKRPGLLEEDDCEKLRTARISGEVFLGCASDIGFFQNACRLPPGTSFMLAKLATELAKEGTAGAKGKLLSFIHAHHIDCKLTTS